MNKYGISEAKSKVGFRAYEVPDAAVKNVRRSFGSLVIRSAVFVTMAALVFTNSAPSTLASSQGQYNPYGGKTLSKDDKVTICHADGDKFEKKTETVKNIDEKKNHGSHNNDIIPPFKYKLSNHGQTKNYSGKNWTADNIQIYKNNCKTPKTHDDVVVCTADGSIKTFDGKDAKKAANKFVKDNPGSKILADGEDCGQVAGCDDENSQDNPECLPDCDANPQAEGCTPPNGPTPEPCGTELVKNGGFEAPEVTHAEKWDIFPEGTTDLEWQAEWVVGGPSPANVELHRNVVAGWTAKGGQQYTELDSDHGGPSDTGNNGEAASVKIYQDLVTKSGSDYKIVFYTSPRPDKGADDNKIKFSWTGKTDVLLELGDGNGSTTDWTKHTYTFTATGTTTRIAFADAGNSESHGSFLDSVSVKEDCPPEPEPTGPLLHFIKVVCADYGYVVGNESADQRDDTGGNYVYFKPGSVTKPVSPAEIPDNCERVDGWQFKLSTGVENDYKDQVGDIQIVGPTVAGEYVTPISGAGSVLNSALQDGIRNGSFWVSEVLQDGYGFAAIRCYNDALNGDNMEFINLGQDNPDHIYCIAYNVADELPSSCIATGWAANVVSHNQGKRKDGGDVLAGRSNPNLATGAADWTSGGSTGFYSLGFGGEIILEFSGYVWNVDGVDGNDLSIHEATNGTYPLESVTVEVSQDGTNWELAGIADNTPGDKVTYLDFDSTGFDWIKFVKITDTTPAGPHADDADGFDLDAVDATTESCDLPPVEPCQEIDLIENGSFEDPTVNHASGWNTFVSTILGWFASWTDADPGTFNGDSRPEAANIELQAGVNGWTAYEGSNYAELDSDWAGPDSDTHGEPANIKLSQKVYAVTGTEYELSFNFSARPGIASNVMEVYWNGDLVDTISEDGSALADLDWKTHTFTVIGAAGDDMLEFHEVGTADSFGSFLDDVKLIGCGMDDPEGNSGGEEGSEEPETPPSPQSRSTGRVLSENTDDSFGGLPFQQPLNPQVLGEVTELPRTGTPLSLAFSFVALLTIIFVPRLAIAKD